MFFDLQALEVCSFSGYELSSPVQRRQKCQKNIQNSLNLSIFLKNKAEIELEK